MRVMAQMGMVMNLDKCIGCHTCSVTCKQAWTNRTGVEYVWFNNVETRPGQGYPRTYEDQERWKGGWEVGRNGKLKLRTGSRLRRLLTIFSNPGQPSIGDYYEPWTYDYETLTNAPVQEHTPVARPRSLLSNEPMKVEWSANWDDDLGGAPELTQGDPVLQKISAQVKQQFEQTYMFYLPRICEHCINPSCAASWPTYLRDAFDLSPGDAALRTAGFVVLAVVMRPFGGWLSDRLHPVPVLVACFAVVTVFAAVSAIEAPLAPVGTIAFLAMAAALGASSGAVFALVALAAPAGKAVPSPASSAPQAGSGGLLRRWRWASSTAGWATTGPVCGSSR